jgi:hypothetical protein
MFDALSDCDRIALAKRKMERVLNHVINLAAIHENNAIVVFSPMLVDQIPRSYAAHAFNVFQHVMHDFEMVRLCALWISPQNAEDETESIPTVVAIIDHPSVIDALVQTERSHWGDITARNMASLNPALTELELEAIKQNEDKFGEGQASKARSDLLEAISQTKRLRASPRFTALKNHRDKYLAHSLASTKHEKKTGQPLPLAKYNYATKLFDLSIPIVEKLYHCVTGKGFDISQSQKISKRCAEALWGRCTFTIGDND